MMKCINFMIAALLGIAGVGCASAAEIKVFSAAAMGGLLKDLSQDFETKTGHKLLVTLGPAGALKKRVEDGESADIIIVTAAGIDDLDKQGKLLANSKAALAKVGVAVAVRAGAPKPDISSADAFKRALISAKTIARGDPASGGAGSVHVARVIERLGIDDDVKAKSKLAAGAAIAQLVAKGEADIALAQNSEIAGVEGAELVGPFPGDLQNISVFSGAVVASSKEPEAARAWLDHIKSPAGVPVLKTRGMEPG
jgi:molybdate transport system substrate-binding protein